MSDVPDRQVSEHVHARCEPWKADKIWAAYCVLRLKFGSAREAIEWVRDVDRLTPPEGGDTG